MPASSAIPTAVGTNGAVMITDAGMPRFSKKMASSTLLDQRLCLLLGDGNTRVCLGQPHDLADAAALAQQVGDSFEDHHAVGLAVREKADRDTGQMRRSSRERRGRRDTRRSDRWIENAHHDGTSLVTNGTDRPRLHDGKKAEWPPACPPPTQSRISSRPSPRCTRT